MKKNSWVKKRHNFALWLLRYPIKFFMFLLFGLSCKKYKLKKGENAFVIANHQSDFDSIFVSLSLNKPIYYVSTDSLFSNRFTSKLLNFFFAPIPKKKGFTDPRCIKTMLKVAKEKGSVGLFAEGNRSYAEFQFHIDKGLSRLIKTMKIPVLLFNIHGGNGCFPRFSRKKRKGKLYTEMKLRIDPSEYLNMSDEELLALIKENIKIYDSENNYEYKSKVRAEYLERMLFVCPSCNSISTLYSKNEHVLCSKCGLKVEYTTKLHLKSEDENFNFERLIDWYDFQRKWCLNSSFENGEIIFKDEDVKLYETFVNKPRKLLCEGKLTLTTEKLLFNDKEILLKDISIASVIGGKKFNFTADNVDYLVIGHDRFNPLKYVLMFNKLETHMKIKETDKYFSLN